MNNSYCKSNEEVLDIVESNIIGLTEKEANNRLSKYGKNILPKKERDSIFKIFLCVL